MKRKDILTLLVPTFIFIFAWIGFGIYHNSVKSTISEELNMQITPISPDFDTKTIDKLKKRQNVTPIYQTNESTQSSAIVPTPVVTLPISGTSSAEQATLGGSLSQ